MGSILRFCGGKKKRNNKKVVGRKAEVWWCNIRRQREKTVKSRKNSDAKSRDDRTINMEVRNTMEMNI